MTDAVLKAVEAATGTDLGAIQVLQGTTPVKIAKSTIVDANGNPISYAVLDVKGAGAAADALRVHLSNEALAALEQITATVTGPIALDAATLAALDAVDLNAATISAITGTDGATPPSIPGTGVRGWLRSIYDRLTAGIGRTWTLASGTDSVTANQGTPGAQAWPVTGTVEANVRSNGAGVSAANPMPAQLSQGNAAVTAANPVPVQLSQAGAAASFQNPVPVADGAVSLVQCVLGTANTALTVTLPAVAGMKHYITGIRFSRLNGATAATAGAPLAITTTNLPSGLAFRYPSVALAANGVDTLYARDLATPIQSVAANTPTTIVLPIPGATATTVQWFVEIYYYTAV